MTIISYKKSTTLIHTPHNNLDYPSASYHKLNTSERNQLTYHYLPLDFRYNRINQETSEFSV